MHTTRISIAAAGAASLLLVFACSCEMPGADSARNLRIASYNVQTLFDDEYQGSEFPEYIPSDEGWNTVAYHLRLRNLARVIRDMCDGGPDILCLEEVENSAIAEDLLKYFLRDLDYSYLASGKIPGAAFGQLVLSRHPILSARLIGAEYRGYGLRPALEVLVDTGDHLGPVRIFAVHWKSKLGDDARLNEEMRRMQAHVLSRRIAGCLSLEPEIPLIVAGDFNESWLEFQNVAAGEYKTALVGMDELTDWEAADGDPALEPLLLAGSAEADCRFPDPDHPLRLIHFWDRIGEDSGSYAFDGRWEAIDNILLGGTFPANCSSLRMRRVDHPYLLSSSGSPKSYRIGASSGFSDHLPLILEISW